MFSEFLPAIFIGVISGMRVKGHMAHLTPNSSDCSSGHSVELSGIRPDEVKVRIIAQVL
jgi:hypothetical protein